ncbi:MAG: glycerol-3-phosphate dehydrogenase/oxidase [Desulfobacterales bacterium]
MQRDIQRLKSEQFDLLVIGGGITGACLAHEAALRGIKTALVEKDDFGGFTSAASSKLLHGGIRYLPKLQLHKVRESARERAVFQRIAPHLTRTIPFIVPTFGNNFMQGQLAMTAGMGLYEFMRCGLNRKIPDSAKRIPPCYRLKRNDLLQTYPQTCGLTALTGAWVLPEVHMHNSERMTLAVIETACRNGVCAANYAPVSKLIGEKNRISGVEVTDRVSHETFKIRARIVANAAGPLIPKLYQQNSRLRLKRPTTGYAKGVHLVTRQFNSDYALGLNTPSRTEGYLHRGGRHIFIIPWRGRSLIGTTNVPFSGDLDEVSVTRKDVIDFLGDINRALPSAGLTLQDVHYAFCGLYPLVAQDIEPGTYQGTGEYQIIDHGDQDDIAGIVTVLGAKFTTARVVAEKASRLIARKLKHMPAGRPGRKRPLLGGDIPDLDQFCRQAEATYKHALDPGTVRHLIQRYGNRFPAVYEQIQSVPQGLRLLSPDRNTLQGEIDYFLNQEMALHLDDVIFRRSGLGTIGHPGDDVISRVGEIMARHLGWGEAQLQDQILRVERRFSYR